MDIFSNDKIKWEKQVREFEKEYLSLTKLEQIPIYEIHFIKPTNDISYSMQIINSSKSYILNVNMGFMYLTDFDYKETLVHEFTHMIDYSTLLLDKDENSEKMYCLYIQNFMLHMNSANILHKQKNLLTIK